MRKDIVMNYIIGEYRLKKEEIISVGDSKYDIPMFDLSGFSIAFDPKDDEVANRANVTIHERNLLRILDYIKL